MSVSLDLIRSSIMEKIDFDHFSKMDIRIGKVLSAERVEGSDKLILLKVDLGEDKDRQLVAGIGKVYEPEDLIDTFVTVLANLKPREIFGHESNGMILAAGTQDGPVILSPRNHVEPGSSVS